MAIGASFGRMVGILVEALHGAFPQSRFFSACEPDIPCITPGTYAFLGAGAALSGIMHITVSVVVIMFELTGALTYILPTMIVVGTTKAISAYFPPGGIADRMISFNGFPFLDTKEEHTFHVSVSSVMTPVSNITLLPSTGLSLRALEALLRKSSVQGFPVVEDRASRVLLGYIGRTELRYAIDKTKKEQSLGPDTKCLFFAPASTAVRTPSALTPPVTFEQMSPSSVIQTVDFSRFVDPTPLAVHPRLALETVMELFKKMGPRVILVELKGHLMGLVTVKDCLKYQFKVEAQERGGEGQTQADRFEAWLWERMRRLGDWTGSLMGRVSGGRIMLGLGEARGEGLLAAESQDPRDARESIGGAVLREEEERGILDGTENDEEGVELRAR
ncbi:glycerol ethanol, ferric requiring protein [Xylographa parallela]|nr:glycerol ethanol, ferric requiring protein [Xylographa parallela]